MQLTLPKTPKQSSEQEVKEKYLKKRISLYLECQGHTDYYPTIHTIH